jgi:hypothetical protein
MSTMTQYTCQRELLPMVEAALAANGYAIQVPRQKQINGATSLVMGQGAVVVLLIESAHHESAEIEVWGEARSAAIRLLESLPIPLRKQAQTSTLVR